MKRIGCVITARCEKNKKLFGIRAEKKGNIWHFTWAFKINEAIAKREGYDKANIKGSLTETDDEYPGCPYCGGKGLTHRSCGNLCCNDGSDYFTCPWCGDSGALSTGWDDNINLSGGGY